MIIKDNAELQSYIPMGWWPLHPALYQLALKAVAADLAEISVDQDKIYWRRSIDNPQLELGL